jgi:hypothetical protein
MCECSKSIIKMEEIKKVINELKSKVDELENRVSYLEKETNVVKPQEGFTNWKSVRKGTSIIFRGEKYKVLDIGNCLTKRPKMIVTFGLKEGDIVIKKYECLLCPTSQIPLVDGYMCFDKFV